MEVVDRRADYGFHSRFQRGSQLISEVRFPCAVDAVDTDSADTGAIEASDCIRNRAQQTFAVSAALRQAQGDGRGTPYGEGLAPAKQARPAAASSASRMLVLPVTPMPPIVEPSVPTIGMPPVNPVNIGSP